MEKIRVAINGAAGRMGRRLVALGVADERLAVVAAIEGEASPHLGKDAGLLAGVGELGVPITADIPEDANVDVVIDFSLPVGAEAITAKCLAGNLPLIIATTGLSDDQQQKIHQAAKTIPIVWAPSMSLAVNLTMKLVEMAAGALKDIASGVDVEIIERHHRFKEDAPSGTALKFGEIVAEQMGQTNQAHGREGRPGIRPRNEIGYHAVRTGDNPGEHTIIFGLLGETIELQVAATSRDAYAMGALAGAKYIVGKPPRLYNMKDVLGLD